MEEAESALALELQVFVGLKLVSSAPEVGLVQAETETALLEAAAASAPELQVFVGLKWASFVSTRVTVQADAAMAVLEAAALAPVPLKLQVFVGSEPASSVLAEVSAQMEAVTALLEAVASAGELQVSVGLGPVCGGPGAEWAPAAAAAVAAAVKATPPAVAVGTGRRAAETAADRRLQADPARTPELEHSTTLTLARRTTPQASHRYRTTEHIQGH